MPVAALPYLPVQYDLHALGVCLRESKALPLKARGTPPCDCSSNSRTGLNPVAWCASRSRAWSPSRTTEGAFRCLCVEVLSKWPDPVCTAADEDMCLCFCQLAIGLGWIRLSHLSIVTVGSTHDCVHEKKPEPVRNWGSHQEGFRLLLLGEAAYATKAPAKI
eukprot:3703079-Amphidinium_carterae.1